MNKRLLYILVLGVFTVFPQISFSQVSDSTFSDSKKIVQAIEIDGNKTIGVSTILSKIKTRVGQEYIQNIISDDLKRLYNTGYFSDVSVDRKDYQNGFKVIIIVKEKPIIDDVTFSKTKYIKTRTLRRNMKTKEGRFLDKKDLKTDIEKMKETYAQKGLTQAEIDAETLIDDVTNKASLHFIVKEGFKIRIRRINMFGNIAFKRSKLLKVLKSKTKNLIRSGYLKQDILDADKERIITFYEQQGFIDATVDYKIDYLVKGYIDVNITINEGRRYFVGDIALKGNSVISDKEILKAMENTAVGKVFSREKLTVDIVKIRTLYFDKGYIFANVRESSSLDPDTGNVEVKIEIVEGDVAYIEKVVVQGNTRTRDIVVRRELRLFPGDRFDGGKLKRSKERLTNLGYFEDVSFDIEDTDNYDRKDLVVQVKEAKTGTFSFGGGFSTIDKVVGFIEVEQRNFDFTNWPTFTGGGQKLSLRAETGTTRNNLRLSFTEPWIMDYPVSGGFDAYKSERTRSEDIGYAYDESKIGGNVRFGKQFTEYVSGGVSYKRERIKIGDIESNVSADLLAEEGTNTVSAVGFNVSRDSTDSAFSPTKGTVFSCGIDVAGGFLGGTKDFYRLQALGSVFVPLMYKSVLEFRTKIGFVDAYDDSNKVPIFERFFAGGSRSIRGYNERKVGPLDANTNDPVGGESMMVSNIEYTIPIVDFIKFATFFDFGNVWADVNNFGTEEFKAGTGLGLRIKTPVGPINLDYGYPLNDEPGEQTRSGKFYFSVSRGF